MRKLIAKLNCKSKPFVMDDTCISLAAREDTAATAAVSAGRTTTNNPTLMMHPTLCMYLLTKEVATTVDFDVLIHAIRTNDCLVRIHIMGNFVTELSVMQQHLLWTVICQAPALRSIGFMDFNDNTNRNHQDHDHDHDTSSSLMLRTSLLKMILEGRQKFGQEGLQELELSHVMLQGDLSDLSNALCAHTSLRTVSVWDIDHVNVDAAAAATNRHRSNNNNNTDVLLQMLVNIQQVENLLLGRSFQFDETQIQLVAKAVSHPDHQLRILRLIGGTNQHHNNNNIGDSLVYDDDLFHPMMQDRNHNRLTYQSCLALADMLKVNQCLIDLELTNLQLVPQEEEEQASGNDTVIQTTLQQQSSSTTPASTTTTRSGLIEMIKALQHHNRTLKSFQLFQRNLFSRHDMTPQENDALVEMLQDNPILERCLPNGTGRAHETVLLQLKLNRCKLRKIHVDVNLQRPYVVELLGSSDLLGDLDCFYHVLRANPSMMQQ